MFGAGKCAEATFGGNLPAGGGAHKDRGLVALVDALGLAVEVGVEAVADRGATAAGAARRDSEPSRTGGRPVAIAERGRYAVVTVVSWLELTQLRKSAESPDRYGDNY